MIPKIETERLILRAFHLNDAKEVQRIAGNYEIYKTTLNVPHPYLDGMAEGWIEKHESDFIERSFLTLAIVRKIDEELIGCISLGINEKRKIGEIGYWVSLDHWGQGYGSEAAQQIIHFGFREMEVNKIIGRHFESNPASGKIMIKCGMKLEGILREDQIKDGVFQNICYYGLLRSEWSQL